MEQSKIDTANSIIKTMRTWPDVYLAGINDYGNHHLFSIYVTPTDNANLRSLIKRIYGIIKRNSGRFPHIMEGPDFRGDYIIDFDL